MKFYLCMALLFSLVNGCLFFEKDPAVNNGSVSNNGVSNNQTSSNNKTASNNSTSSNNKTTSNNKTASNNKTDQTTNQTIDHCSDATRDCHIDSNTSTCEELGFDGGLLGCTEKCTFDTSQCYHCETKQDAECSSGDINATCSEYLKVPAIGTPTCSLKCELGYNSCIAIQGLSAGDYHSCRLKDEKAVCWGAFIRNHSFGQVSGAPTVLLKSVVAGRNNSAGLTLDGKIEYWGWTAFGLPVTIPPGKFKSLTLGGAHACAINLLDKVECWGSDSNGKQIIPQDSFLQIDAALEHTCGIKMDGSIACWGSNTHGRATPVNGTFTYVGTGENFNCALKVDGTIACWGYNNDQVNSPVGSFAQLSVGGFHSCARAEDGVVSCWGDRQYGQTTVPVDTKFVRIEAGNYHTCGVKLDNTIICWGFNTDKQTEVK